MEENKLRELFERYYLLAQHRDNLQIELDSATCDGATQEEIDEVTREVDNLKGALAGEVITEAARQKWIKELETKSELEEQRDKLLEQVDELRQQGRLVEKEAPGEALDFYMEAVNLTYNRVGPNAADLTYNRAGLPIATEAAVEIAGMSPDDPITKKMIAAWKTRKDILLEVERVVEKMPDPAKCLRWFEEILAVPHDASTTRIILDTMGNIGDEKTATALLRCKQFNAALERSRTRRKSKSDTSNTPYVYVPDELMAEWWVAISKLWLRLKPVNLLDFLERTAEGKIKPSREIARAILDGKELNIKSIHLGGRYLEI